ncbi:MAG TPA: hypothetical protein VKW04_22750 [Planctomycetota bacterium]|nr:hypothetical protein [Planctomycetota bacterium]
MPALRPLLPPRLRSRLRFAGGSPVEGEIDSTFGYENDIVVTPEKPLVLRYRFLVHGGPGNPAVLDAEGRRFSE